MASIVVADGHEAAATAPAQRCFHCGAAVPAPSRWQWQVGDAARHFCCGGCLAISQTIDAAGLAAYYGRRTGAGATPPAIDEERDWGGSDADALRARFARRDANELEASLLIDGMSCGACVWLLESWLSRQPGVAHASVNFATRRARVRWRTSEGSLARLLASVRAIGYAAHPYDPARRESMARRERRASLSRTAVALLAMMQVMMFAVPTYVASDDVAPAQQALFDWASLVLTMPVLVYSAAPLWRGALRDLAMRRLGMDVPIVLGLAAAFGASAWSTLGGGGPVYYDSVTMFVALLLVARHAELVARHRAGDAIERVARARPAIAERLVDWPRTSVGESVEAASLVPGDRVLVRPGAGVPADGVVVEGRSHVEEAVLTGESRPRATGVGDAVLEGAINREGALVVRVDAAGDATRLAGVVRLVEAAAAERPRVARVADRIAHAFVGALLLLAIVVGAYWHAVEPSLALPIVFALLVVSCPCALSLATPATFAAAAGALSRMQVVAARPDALETLARVSDVVFDKTGTLTQGRLRLVATHAPAVDVAAALARAAALEAFSEHPLARALRDCAPDAATTAARVIVHTGQGIEGEVGGTPYRIGSLPFVEALAGPMGAVLAARLASIPPQATVVALGSVAGVEALFVLDDAERETAGEAIARLHALGVRTHILSGDSARAVAAWSQRLGAGEARGGCSPSDKRQAIADLQAHGAVVAMIGDGVNDAPGLAQAQVSVSLGSAAPLAQWTADIVVLSDDLSRLPLAIAQARRTLSIVRQNLGWAFAYNAVAIPAAALGLVTPLLAAAGMSLSSLAVVLNALRAGRAVRRP